MDSLAKFVAGPVGLASLGFAVRQEEIFVAVPIWALAVVWALAGYRAWRREVQVDVDLEASFEPLPGKTETLSDGRTFSDLTALWVGVRNNGAPATFSAQITNVTPTSRLEDGKFNESGAVDEVAWEHSHDRSYLIGWRKRGRLKVAFSALTPRCFWYWTAQSATWSPTGHGWGWRLVPADRRVEFDLEVLNETYRKSEERHCIIEFAENGEVARFDFRDDGRVR